MQTVPGLVLCEKSEGTLIVFQQDAAGAQDIAHGGIVQVQLQQGADALQPVHQRIAVDEKLPGRGMEVLFLQEVDAQGVQQGGAVGLVVLLQAAQHGVDEGPEVGALGDGADKHVLIQGRGAAAARVNEALVSMWFNNSPEAGNWLIDKCAEFGVVPVSFRAHAPNAIIPESYDYHMFVNVGDHQFDSKCGYFAATNVLYEDSQNAEKYEHPATYFFNTKAQELLVEDGRVTGVFAQRDGELWLFRATKGVILATDGKISDIVVNSHAESSDIGAPALDKLIQNAIAANSAEIDGASGATMTSDGFREAVAQALAKAQ